MEVSFYCDDIQMTGSEMNWQRFVTVAVVVAVVVVAVVVVAVVGVGVER